MCGTVKFNQNDTFKNQARIIYLEKITILFNLCSLLYLMVFLNYLRSYNAKKESDTILFTKNLKKAITFARHKKAHRNGKWLNYRILNIITFLVFSLMTHFEQDMQHSFYGRSGVTF